VHLLRSPRIGVYAPWGGGSTDEGWTRWILERYGFDTTTLHNADLRTLSGRDLRLEFDAIVLADQPPGEIVNGQVDETTPPEYRGGIGEQGIERLNAFVSAGGTLVALGSASHFVIDHMRVPVRDVKRLLRRDQHAGPGSIIQIDVNASNVIGYGMAPHTRAFYVNGPIFTVAEDQSDRVTIIASYSERGLLASGSLIGGHHMAGRAAVVSIDARPGRIVLFGIRPQHRAQTEVTFPLLFNALYLSAVSEARASDSQ
jgi:hypothetical protein